MGGFEGWSVQFPKVGCPFGGAVVGGGGVSSLSKVPRTVKPGLLWSHTNAWRSETNLAKPDHQSVSSVCDAGRLIRSTSGTLGSHS